MLAPVLAAKRPDLARRHVFISEAGMARQVLRRFRRTARLEVGGRGASHHARLAEFARDHRLAARRADADREVVALLHQIDDAVGERDVELHRGILGEELADRRRDVAHAEVDGSGEAQGAARAGGAFGGGALRIVEIREQLHAALVETLAALGEREAPRGAVEQPRLEMRFQLRDQPRAGRRGNGQPVGGAREAALLDHLGKHGHGLQAVQRLSLI